MTEYERISLAIQLIQALSTMTDSNVRRHLRQAFIDKSLKLLDLEKPSQKSALSAKKKKVL